MKSKHKNKMIEPKEDKGMQNWFRSKLFTMKMEQKDKEKHPIKHDIDRLKTVCDNIKEKQNEEK